MGYIESIDTFYNGNNFRSRLEARWAVYFDLIGIKYEYEPQGYMFNGKYSYLPDFYLPNLKLYCEIKNESAFFVENNHKLMDGTEKAYKYIQAGKAFARNGIMYVVLMGTPYDYLAHPEKEWWVYQDECFEITVGDYTMDYAKAIRNVLIDNVLLQLFKDEAKCAQSVRFEHGDSAEESVKKYKINKLLDKLGYSIEIFRANLKTNSFSENSMNNLLVNANKLLCDIMQQCGTKKDEGGNYD